MKAKELVEEIATMLGEDFEYAPLWTEVELFKELQVVLRLFGELTQLADRCQVCLVDYTTGEVDLPEDFGQLYFGQFSQEFMDVVDLNELEFLSETWMADSRGGPKGMTVWGQGGRSKARFVPVPSTVEVFAGGGSGVDEIVIASSPGGVLWKVVCTSGVLVSSSTASAASAVQVIEGYGSYWNLGITDAGELTLSASSSTTESNLVFNDSVGNGQLWAVNAELGGVLDTQYAQWGPGVCVGVLLTKDGVDTYQDFNGDYGIVVDAYADGVGTTPDHVIKLESDYGFVQYCGQYEGCGTMWYKGLFRRLYSLYNEVMVNDGLLPVIKHGVLARAWAKEGDGQDLQKSKLMSMVFVNECKALKNSFGKRW